MIIPVADPSREFKGNEYLQIYKHLELTLDDKVYIVDPDFTEIGKIFFEFEVKNMKVFLWETSLEA